MGEVPVGLKPRMRELSEGPIPWGLWSLTHHDGSTWVALAFEGQEHVSENLIGWACVSAEYDRLPMVGAYVALDHRGNGLGSELVTTILRSLLCSGDLSLGDTLYASLGRWPTYVDLLESCGLRCVEWV